MALLMAAPVGAQHTTSAHHAKVRVLGRQLLARFITHFHPDKENRSHNIRLAIKRINGRLLLPGHIFSVNSAVGNRTHKNGFLTAPVIEEGKVVPGIGGGVSQVSGTLFNAALLAGLKIVECHNHAEPVTYLPIGRDATVAWENKLDMRFLNDTSAPVEIVVKCQGENLIAALYGHKAPDKRVNLTVHSQKIAAHHLKAQLWRTIRKQGKVVSKERIAAYDYQWQPTQPE